MANTKTKSSTSGGRTKKSGSGSNRVVVRSFVSETVISRARLFAFILVFAGIGSYLLTSGFAATTTGTFGKTTVGARCDDFSDDLKRVNEYSLGSKANVSSISMYLIPGWNSGTENIRGVMYADDNGKPGSLIGATDPLAFQKSFSAKWYKLPFSSSPTLEPGRYWIGIFTGDPSGVAGYCYDTASSNVRDINANKYSLGASNPFGNFESDNRSMSVYATFTTSTSGVAPTVQLTANPTSITSGQSSTLIWSSSNASGCSAPWTGLTATSGKQSVSPTANTTYTITCNGTGGSGSASAQVVVNTGNPATPKVTVSANPSAITSGQSSTLSWSSSNTSSCAANWTSSNSVNGSQVVAPASTTTYTMTCSGAGGSASATATVSVSSSGGGGISCNTTLSGSQVVQLANNTYHLQSNEWGSGAPFSICTDGNSDFKITNSQINVPTNGAPGAYPSIYKGCHWGYCTSNSGLPVNVSTLTSTANKVTTSYNTSVISGGAWDDSYDNWYNANASTNNNSASGLEMMIWINHNGPIQPAGSVVTKSAMIDGMSWTVWHGGGSPGGTVSYVLNSPTTAVTNMDLGPFSADSVNRGYLPNTWYLIDVEAGFEPWQGGTGLTANSFNVTVH